MTFGNLVSVHKDTDDSKNGVYTYTNPGWVYLAKLGDMSDMVTKSTDQVINAIKTFNKSPIVPIAENQNEAINKGQLDKIGVIIENKEWLIAVTDNENNIFWGIRENGESYIAKGIPEELRAVFLKIDELYDTKVDKQIGFDLINDKYKEVFTSNEDVSLIYAITDIENKVLLSIDVLGNVYIPNKRMLDVSEYKEYLQIVLDADKKVLAYRDENGYWHEINLKTKNFEVDNIKIKNNISFSSRAMTSLTEALKNDGFNTGMGDLSDDSFIQLPVPLVAAKVNIKSNGLPPSGKTQDIPAVLEYYDKLGNSFKKNIIWNAQGSSSMGYMKKNFKFDIVDGSEIKFGDWVAQDSFHLKAYYIDAFRGQNNVCYELCEQIFQSRNFFDRRPWDYLNNNVTEMDSNGDIKKDISTGATTVPKGFPIILYHNGEFYGIYSWNIKKHRANYNMDKKDPLNIMLDGVINKDTLFGGVVNWQRVEVKSPKGLIDIDGNKYDGDNPKELSDTDKFSSKVKKAILRLSNLMEFLEKNTDKESFESILMPSFMIDYFTEAQVVYNFDGVTNNWLWCTWDGELWCPTFYDQDSVFGMHWQGNYIYHRSHNSTIIGDSQNTPTGKLINLYKDDIDKRYAELRNNGIYSVENIISLFEKWVNRVGYDNYKLEFKKWNETPSFRSSKANKGWVYYSVNSTYYDEFSIDKEYKKGDRCRYNNFVYEVTIDTIKGIAPSIGTYPNYPKDVGFYNSIKRVAVWLESRLQFCDEYFNYK